MTTNDTEASWIFNSFKEFYYTGISAVESE